MSSSRKNQTLRSLRQLISKMAKHHGHLHSKVGIIGAGISGIAAAKQLFHYNPIIFEATDSIGGVWKHCCYNSTKLQTPRRNFEFSDFPWPERDSSSFPSYLEILEYLNNYATHFDVLKFVNFNSKVVEIRYVGDHSIENSHMSMADSNKPEQEYGRLLGGLPAWEVAVENTLSKTIQWYGFEFVVLCIGKYGDIPVKPSYPPNKGPKIFKGTVMHSMDYSKLDKEAAYQLFKGKKVAVVGYKKSAIDLAMECAEANSGPEGQPCTMVIRTVRWTIPSYRIWGLPFFLFYSTRSSQFLHEWPNQTLFRALLCRLASPMRKAISKFIESYLVWKLPLEKYGLKPDHPFVEDYASCQLNILPENFFFEANKGMIQFKKASKWWFWSKGLEFEDNTKLEVDIVVLATGFDGKRKLQTILPEAFNNSLMVDSSGIMSLYRGTIHPLIPNMAFMGYIESASNLQITELRCKWLARLANEHFKLPSVTKMLHQVNEEIGVMKRTTRFYKRHCISTFSINHSDEICKEMGESPWRKSNWFSKVFSPYNNQDYL